MHLACFTGSPVHHIRQTQLTLSVTVSDRSDLEVSDGASDSEADVMANYDVADEADIKDAQAEARHIKLSFDRKDPKSWFQRLEIRLEFAGIKSQWLKRLCLENLLPEDIAHCCKDYFSKPKTECTGDLVLIYKKCKTRILETWTKTRRRFYVLF